MRTKTRFCRVWRKKAESVTVRGQGRSFVSGIFFSLNQCLDESFCEKYSKTCKPVKLTL